MAEFDDSSSSRVPRSKRRGIGSSGANGTSKDRRTKALAAGAGDRLAVALEALHRGEFDYRLRTRDGVGRDVVEAFNALAETSREQYRRARARSRASSARRRDGRAPPDGRAPRWLGDDRRIVQHADRRPRAAVHRGRPRDRGRRRGRPVAEDGPRDRRQARAGRVPSHRDDRQSDGRSTPRFRERGHARRARGRHRRQARWTGERRRRRRHVEGSHRQRQRHGDEPDDAGARHRRRRHRRRERRPLEEARRRDPGRDPRAEEHRQHDGRSALVVRPRGHPRREARSVPKASSAARRRCAASAGTWKDLTDSVNGLAGNLTVQLRDVSKVATAIAVRRPRAEDRASRCRARCCRSRT